MFKGINSNCVFFYNGCLHPGRENNHCGSKTCPLIRDLNLPSGDYDKISHINVTSWADLRDRQKKAEEMSAQKERLRKKLEKEMKDLKPIRLTLSARGYHGLNGMLIKAKEYGFELAPNFQIVYKLHPNANQDITVVVEGPREHADKIQKILLGY